MKRTVGFIALGVMGAPMARNLLAAGWPLVVWNRTPEPVGVMARMGATVAASPMDVIRGADTTLVMLANEAAMDSVLQPGSALFKDAMPGKTLVHMGTTSPAFSKALEARVRNAGGTYLEAPVSGSKVPAEQGQLVGMLAGDRRACEELGSLLAPVCADVFYCGPVPCALTTKLAVNLFLITMVTGLVEAVEFAKRSQVDLRQFQAILEAGPMSSKVLRAKLPKLLDSDLDPQASILDVLKNNALIAGEARTARIATPLLDVCHRLFGETVALGHGQEDMVAVLAALQARTELARRADLSSEQAGSRP